MDDATIDAKIAAIPAVDYERIGERMHLEMIYVNYGAEAGADKYLELVKKAYVNSDKLAVLTAHKGDFYLLNEDGLKRFSD